MRGLIVCLLLSSVLAAGSLGLNLATYRRHKLPDPIAPPVYMYLIPSENASQTWEP